MDYNEQVNQVKDVIENLIHENEEGSSVYPRQLSQDEQSKTAQQYFESTGHHIEFINAGDMFDFECQRCGKCCMGREDIIMNPLDIFHIAQATGETTEEVCKKYTVLSIGPNSGLPILCLKTDSRNWCSFLELDVAAGGKFKCSIDRYKPGACRNHPIGIMMGFEKKDPNARLDENMQYTENYIMVDQCGNSRGHNHMNRVDDWVGNTLSTPEERKMAHILSLGPSYILELPKLYAMIVNAVMVLSTIGMGKFDEFFEGEDKNDIINKVKGLNRGDGTFTGTLIWYTDYVKEIVESLMHTIYYDYDASQDYVQQAKKNWKILETKMIEVKNEYDLLYQFMVNDLHFDKRSIFSMPDGATLQQAVNIALEVREIMIREKEGLENALES